MFDNNKYIFIELHTHMQMDAHQYVEHNDTIKTSDTVF